MAQNLLKFETENDYRIAKINHLIVPHICYVKESGKSYISSVMSNRVDAVSGDIIAFNNADNTMAFIKPEAYTMEIATKYTPVAVVVIPQTHTSDNKVVGVSLKAMSTTSPVNGSVDTNGIVWGRGIDVINKRDYIVCINIEDNNNPSATIANATMSYLPSDKFFNGEASVDNIVDVYSKWNKAAGTYTPSPYLIDGKQSSRYVTSEVNNALNDMSVKDFTLMDNGTAGRVCSQFNVPLYMGVGQWYLPSVGELGYMVTRAESISYALSQIKNTNRTLAALLVTEKPYWSSTLNEVGDSAWCVNISNGLVAKSSVENENYVRAFARF